MWKLMAIIELCSLLRRIQQPAPRAFLSEGGLHKNLQQLFLLVNCGFLGRGGMYRGSRFCWTPNCIREEIRLSHLNVPNLGHGIKLPTCSKKDSRGPVFNGSTCRNQDSDKGPHTNATGDIGNISGLWVCHLVGIWNNMVSFLVDQKSLLFSQGEKRWT